MRDALYYALFVFLVFSLLLGLLRVMKGPSVVDRMLAFLLLGTVGTSILLAFYAYTGAGFLLNVALAFALLAGIVGIAFAIILFRDDSS